MDEVQNLFGGRIYELEVERRDLNKSSQEKIEIYLNLPSGQNTSIIPHVLKNNQNSHDSANVGDLNQPVAQKVI